MERTLLDTAAAAKALGLTARELSNLARIGKSPPFVQLGGRRGKRWYAPTDLDAWKRKQASPEDRSLFDRRPARTYTVEDLSRLTGLPKGVIFARSRHGEMPAPMGLANVRGARKHVWAADTFDEWLALPKDSKPAPQQQQEPNDCGSQVEPMLLAALTARVEVLENCIRELQEKAGETAAFLSRVGSVFSEGFPSAPKRRGEME